MNAKTTVLLHEWFDGLNRGDIRGLLRLFAPTCRIHNAANPPDEMPGAAERLLTEFMRRTQGRSFELVEAASRGASIYACWTGMLTFRSGIAIAEVILPSALPVVLTGVDVFELDEEDRIKRLLIAHETTSVVVAARALAGGGSTSMPDLASLVQGYFEAEEKGDADSIVQMCDPRVVIINAAQPPIYGLDGARQFVEDFRGRTLERRFAVHSIAIEGHSVFAEFTATITFREGAAFGPTIRANRPFTTQLPGVCRFQFNPAGKLIALRVFHETTTAPRLAQAA